MSAGRFALLVATGHYENRELRRLRSPVRDAEGLAEVLRDPGIGGFTVTTIVDRRHHEVARAIEHFFLDRGRDDLLLLHISSHGVKNDDGELYFAAADTDRRLLASTAVSAEFLRTQMQRCRARSVVLLLDCCYSGAFLPGAKGDTAVHLRDELAGHGRAVLTATNRTEYAWEGERLDELEPEPSRFTGAVIKGLRSGEADRNGDGLISTQDLYEYVYDELRAAGVRQRPQLWAQVERQLVVARSVTAPRQHPLPGIPAQADRPAPSVVPDVPPPVPEQPRPANGFARLLILVKLLCELPSLADVQTRMRFAVVLGEHLGRTVDLRGVRLQEDAAMLARSALAAEGGEDTLMRVIELYEGGAAADRIRQRLDRASGEAHGANGGDAGDMQLLLNLTDALCALPSVQDPQGRQNAASLLAEVLGRPVDVRGMRLREDVVAIVRAALKVPGGEHALVDVIRVLDGEQQAAELERLLQTAH
ncbi:hypothetical protein GCM10009535_09290 [Streptomyces thermocarboxydovorans]|uniref:Caspase domain-containing protein n=1 Tax=Streptomyces thermocarboxydovorans TaxID=59298 RepID=A0ABP3SES8_9ACTN